MTKDEILKIHREAICDYYLPGLSGIETESTTTDMAAKGFLINQGYCGNYAHYLVSKLVKKMDHERIKVYEWSPLHVVVVVDDEIILDAEYPEGIEFNRNNLNVLFLTYASRIALSLGEYYYIVASNGLAIIYDPWDFVDNQHFDYAGKSVIPAIEKVYTVDKFLSQYYGQLTLGRLIYALDKCDKSKPVYFSDDGTRPCGIHGYAKYDEELAIDFNGKGNESEEVIPNVEMLLRCLEQAREKQFSAGPADDTFVTTYDTLISKAMFEKTNGDLIVGVKELEDKVELVVKGEYSFPYDFKTTIN